MSCHSVTLTTATLLQVSGLREHSFRQAPLPATLLMVITMMMIMHSINFVLGPDKELGGGGQDEDDEM